MMRTILYATYALCLLALLPCARAGAADQPTATSDTLAVAADDLATTAPATNPSKREMIALLTLSANPQVWQARQRVVREMGDRAYPAMAEVLEETNDWQLAKTIFQALVGMGGDRTAAVRGLRRFLARPHGIVDEMERSTRAEAVHVLCELGRQERGDARVRLRDAILGLAEDDDVAVRIAAFEEMPRVCLDDEAPLVQALYAKRLQQLKEPAEIESDLTLKAATQAVVQIEMSIRLSAASQEARALQAYAKRLQVLRTPEEIATDPLLRRYELIIRMTAGDDATSVTAALVRSMTRPTTATAAAPVATPPRQ